MKYKLVSVSLNPSDKVYAVNKYTILGATGTFWAHEK